MGWFDDLVKRWRNEALKRATKAAARTTAERALSTVHKLGESLAEEVVGFGERELERAQGEREDKRAETGDGRDARVKDALAARDARRAQIDAREQRARDELARLKAARNEVD